MRDRKFDPQSRPPWAKKGPRRGGPRDDRRPPRRSLGRGPRDRDGPALLYGWHTVKEALANPKRRFHRLLATENALHRLTEEGITPKLKPTLVRPEDIAAELGPDAVHQGLLAEADPLPSPPLDTLEPSGLLLVLDQITDPHNV